MKQSISKRLMVILLAFIASICLVFGVSPFVKANAADVEDANAFGMSAGVNIYAGNDVESSGIRFSALIGSEKLATLSNNGATNVFFGITIAKGETAPLDICWTASDTTGLTGFNKVEFDGASTYEYTATIMYNSEILAKALALDPVYNSAFDESLSDEENIEAFKNSGKLQKYLYAAYETELTAKAYYQLDTTEATKNYNETDTVTSSIWGALTKFFFDYKIDIEADEDGLVAKYFSGAEMKTGVTVNNFGAISGYDGFGTAKAIYLDGKPVSVTDNTLANFDANDLEDGDIINLCVVDENYKLIDLGLKFKNVVENIATETVFDVTEMKLYYGTNVVNLADAGYTAFYDDGTTQYQLQASPKAYHLASSVFAKNQTTNGQYSDTLQYLQPTLNYLDGAETKTIAVKTAYSPADVNYTGVKVVLKDSAGNACKTFTDTVFATGVIDNAEELGDIFNKADEATTAMSGWPYQVNYYGNITKGVYMLTKTIDASTGFTYKNSYLNFFDGVLDGRGFNIKNLDVHGSKDKPGNGLFSAISSGAVIQNIGFIDVNATYGSVLMGNLSEFNSTYGTYGLSYVGGTYYSDLGHALYREQLGIASTDTTTKITTYLTDTYRQTSSPVYNNVYIKVSSDTTHFMGAISRNLPNKPNMLKGYNLVVEYLPTDTTWIPADYSSSGYGVLFGGAYTLTKPETSTTTETKSYYTPKGIDPASGNWDYANTAGVLNYVPSNPRMYNTSWGNTRIYVVSPVGLVSCVSGSILACNETATEGQYQFISQKNSSKGLRGFIYRFDCYMDSDEQTTDMLGYKNDSITLIMNNMSAHGWPGAGMRKLWVWQNAETEDLTDIYQTAYMTWRNQ